MTETTKCVRCGAPIDEDRGAYGYLTAPGRNSRWDKACAACYVAVWPSPVRLVFHYGVPSWAEEALRTKEVLDRTKRWFRETRDFPVHVFARPEVETLEWQARWSSAGGGSEPRGPYSYRGWCSGLGIVLIVDETETPQSLEWLLWHELGHHEQQEHAHMSDEAWTAENRNEGRTGYEWQDDLGHELDSEERHVNRVATAFMGGKEYARPWWRPRVIAKQHGLALLPDQHAADGTPERRLWVRMRHGLRVPELAPEREASFRAACERWYRVAPPVPPISVYDAVEVSGPVLGGFTAGTRAAEAE